MPDGWTPNPTTIEAMRAECPGVDLEAEHRRFTDYWADVPGAKGRKVRWDSTWRNWMRRASEDTRRGGTRATTADQRRTEALNRVAQHTPWEPPTVGATRTAWTAEGVRAIDA